MGPGPGPGPWARAGPGPPQSVAHLMGPDGTPQEVNLFREKLTLLMKVDPLLTIFVQPPQNRCFRTKKKHK